MRKIDIYADGEYVATTTQCKRCKDATTKIQEAADTYGTLAVAGRGVIDIKSKKITARYATR